MSAKFDELRKQAERIEGEISSKLIFFSKTCSGKKLFKGQSVKEPLLDSDSAIESSSLEINDLLSKLNVVVDQLANCEIPQNLQTIAMFTINQHREIQRDYLNDYKKNLDNYNIRIERENLLESVQMDIDLHRGGSSNYNRRTDMYLKENEHIRSSSRLIDDQISIAVEARENLLSQRNSMKRLQTRLHDVSHRFPIVNSLVQRINFRKKRDSLIIGSIVFFCVLFILFYIFY